MIIAYISNFYIKTFEFVPQIDEINFSNLPIVVCSSHLHLRYPVIYFQVGQPDLNSSYIACGFCNHRQITSVLS